MKQQDNKQFWQRFASIYGTIMERSSDQLYAQICAKIQPYLQQDMQVLELACGTGQLSFPLAKQVKEWEATDFSSSMIAQASKKKPLTNLRFSVADATNLPFHSNSYDAVVISNALHIMPWPHKALEEIKRVLREDGLLFAPTFVRGESLGARIRVAAMQLAGFRVYHSWNAEELAGFLTLNGFEIIDQQEMGDRVAPLSFIMARVKHSLVSR